MKEELLTLFAELKQEHPMRKVYLAFLQDFDFSLEDRWEVFCEAPQNWKKCLPWIFRPNTFPYLDWYDDFYKDRYTTVDLIDIVEKMEVDSYAPQDKIDAFKEELLAENSGSFYNDW